MDDFCDSPKYAELIDEWRGGRKTARELAEVFCELDETYHGYVWYLIAADLGDDDALDDMDTLREVDQVCDEDTHLAELQVALWWHHGVLVDKHPERARARLAEAALPFMDLPSGEAFHEAAVAGNLEEFRDRALAAGLAELQIPPDGSDPAALDSAFARIIELAGWPASLDVTKPLGPALPDRPHNVHTRHAMEQGSS